MEVKGGCNERYEEHEQGKNSKPESEGKKKQEQRQVSKLKKQSLRPTKSSKRQINGNEIASLLNGHHRNSTLSLEEEASISAPKGRPKRQKLQDKMSALRLHLTLEKLLIKPPYITVVDGCKILGNFGHSTALFKRPIAEGKYFIEFKILEDCQKGKKNHSKSAVRIGICTRDFITSFPLGYGDTLAYKSSDGSIVKAGDILSKQSGYKMGDIVGIYLQMSPPAKHSDPEKISQGSFVSFYKNGQLQVRCEPLKQTFYCFAVSLYNFSQVEVLSSSNYSGCFSEGANSYFDYLAQKIPYKDLQNKKIFRI